MPPNDFQATHNGGSMPLTANANTKQVLIQKGAKPRGHICWSMVESSILR